MLQSMGSETPTQHDRNPTVHRQTRAVWGHMALNADVRHTTNRTLRVGDRRQFVSRDELSQTGVSHRYHVGGHARQLLIVHQQDMFDSGATTGRNFEGTAFLRGNRTFNHCGFGDPELI